MSDPSFRPAKRSGIDAAWIVAGTIAVCCCFLFVILPASALLFSRGSPPPSGNATLPPTPAPTAPFEARLDTQYLFQRTELHCCAAGECSNLNPCNDLVFLSFGDGIYSLSGTLVFGSECEETSVHASVLSDGTSSPHVSTTILGTGESEDEEFIVIPITATVALRTGSTYRLAIESSPAKQCEARGVVVWQRLALEQVIVS